MDYGLVAWSAVLGFELLGMATMLVEIGFAAWYARVRRSIRRELAGYVWLPRDLTVEDLADVANWRSEQRGEGLAAD